MRPTLLLDETAHRVHDYRHLITRWRQVARSAGLRLEAFAQTGEFLVYCVRALPGQHDGLYVSAGIHGDEPAGAAGLLAWAERCLPDLARRRELPLLILPCLNPWGLVHNRRSNEDGQDLNRIFHHPRVAPIGALRRLLGSQRYALTLNLHEDYDARGTYLYELHRRKPDLGANLLAGVAAAIPPDQRRRIDERTFNSGVHLRRTRLNTVPFHPEAIYLYEKHTTHSLTFETPSEFGLERRVRAHVLLIEACVRHLQSTRPQMHPA